MDSIIPHYKLKIPVYCINLKRASERRQQMIDEWVNKRGIELTFIEGVDQQDIDISNLPEPFKTNLDIAARYHTIPKRPLYLGEIGCLLSHVKALEHAIKSGLNKVIVIEDDAEPTFADEKEFYERIWEYELDPKKASIILMHDRFNYNVIGKDGKSLILRENNIIRQKYHHILKERCTCTQSILYTNIEAMFVARLALSMMIEPADWSWNYLGIAEREMLGIFTKPLTEHVSINTTYVQPFCEERLFISANKATSFPTTIYAIYNKSHEEFKPWFETIYKIYPTLNIKYYPIDSDNQRNYTISKLEYLLNILIDPLNTDSCVICSDLHIQFFNKFDNEIEEMFNSGYDILFQDDFLLSDFGFFAFKKTAKIKKLFENTLNFLKNDEISKKYVSKTNNCVYLYNCVLHDQEAFKHCLKDVFDIKYSRFSSKFFSYCDRNKIDFENKKPWQPFMEIKLPPSPIYSHRANCTEGINNKKLLLQYINLKQQAII